MERIYTIFASNPCKWDESRKNLIHDSVSIFDKRIYVNVGKINKTKCIEMQSNVLKYDRNVLIKSLLKHYKTIDIMMADYHHYIIER